MLKKEMEFECAFVDAGGLLMAGVDPAGWGGVLAGFGDQHGLELLVEAGFTPEQAVRIATYNGALFLKQADRTGTLAGGKEADLVRDPRQSRCVHQRYPADGNRFQRWRRL